MKILPKLIAAITLIATLSLPTFADDTATTTDAKDQKDLKKVIEDQGINYVETSQKGITLSGYVETSYTEQFGGRGTGFGSGQADLRQFDTSNNNFNINAVKIALEKALPDKNDWAAGFRIDTIYGEDAKYLNDTAINGTSNTSGLALEQALVKFRVPVGNGLDIYAGKFVTFLGYEVIESPANLNFSRGLLFTNLIPLTNTGVYGDYKFNDTVEAKLGIADGWNNSTSPSSVGRGSSFGKAITGQVNVTAPGKNANISQSFIYSPDGEPGVVGTSTAPVAVYDIWGNWNPTFVKDNALLLGFNGDLGTEDNAAFYGIALYAQYKFNKVFSLAGRAEYIHDDATGAYGTAKYGDGGTFGADGTFTPGAQDDYSYTLTANFNVWDNLLTRIEYRLDDLSGNSTGTGTTQIQNQIALDVVYSF